MERAKANGDVVVARFFEVTPDDLKQIAARMEVAARERCNPKEKLIYQAIPGIFFVYDPAITRSSIERNSFLVPPPEQPDPPALPPALNN
jgi:hypothetical protein